ncbi:beta-phosphoglucomutase-like phosphatase (HAD superfamily) [Rhodococcus sp. PvR044]|uniref:HAD hydrolase-like protein n=1 Tax=Rhodococcus sp. PvR044 TaxID=3156402 RepID=UPI0033997D58
MRSVLFDVDGVLIDSYRGYRQVWSRWCAMRSVPFELTWSATHGRRPVETIAEVAPHLDPDAEYSLLRQLMHSAGDQFQAFPAAAPLLRSLPSERWGVVTSGRRATVLSRFRNAGIPEPRVLVPDKAAALQWWHLDELPTPMVAHEAFVLEALHGDRLEPIHSIGF